MLLDLKNLIKKYHMDIKGIIHIGAFLGEEYPLYKKLSIDNLAFFEPQEDLFNQSNPYAFSSASEQLVWK